jgi:DNA-entry nuclease
VYSGQEYTYVVNTSSRKFHTEDCENALSLKEDNRAEFTCTREEMIDKGFTPAGCCKP